MLRRSIGRLGLAAMVMVALALTGCGNSKKGNGYSYTSHVQLAVVQSSRLSTG